MIRSFDCDGCPRRVGSVYQGTWRCQSTYFVQFPRIEVTLRCDLLKIPLGLTQRSVCRQEFKLAYSSLYNVFRHFPYLGSRHKPRTYQFGASQRDSSWERSRGLIQNGIACLDRSATRGCDDYGSSLLCVISSEFPSFLPEGYQRSVRLSYHQTGKACLQEDCQQCTT